MPFPHRARGRLRALLLTVAPALLLLSAPAAADTPDDAAPAVAPQPTYAEHFAGLLAQEPEGAAVVVDGAIGGPVPPEEVERGIHEAFAPLGAPYHIVVTPYLGAGTDGGMDDILPAVRDRLGTDGFYAVLPPSGGFTELAVYGTDLSLEGGRDAVYDAEVYGEPAHEVARVLAAGLSGSEVPEGFEEEDEGGFLAEFRADTDPTRHNGPENLGFLVGIVAGALLSGAGWITWRSLRRGRIVVPVAAVLAALSATGVLVATTYAYTVDAPVGGHEIADPEKLVRLEPPYVVSTARVERIAEALAEDPLYVDPIMPLTREGLEDVPAALAAAPVPVFAAAVPLNHEDEAEGDPEVLAAALASVAEEDGVYLVVGPRHDGVAVGAAAHGLEADAYALWSPMAFNEERTPAAALESAAEALAEVEFTAGDGYRPGFADREVSLPGPRGERYWAGGFFGGLLLVGPLLAVAVIGLFYLAVHLPRLARSRPSRTALGERALRRLAVRETGRVRALVDREPDRIPAGSMVQAEAALMLMDRSPRELDLLGITVLSRRVLAAVEDPDADTVPCIVDPLHPFAAERAQSRTMGGRVPLCEECARLDDRTRSRRVLRLRGGATSHSYRVKPQDPWIRHSFGAKEPRRMVDLLLKENRVH
ncbi:hypothetical protein SAMN05421803_11375 [Nocardiopsis flavescens]|uniref:DUF4350 domain-containing protein n=1 Tax=Nocardiopsis flavescens TaxID=758803 RepID=A0A1M6PGY3_9ACTN|nr:hypothetical protein [Nocardiopsis flavescens]SHK07147.1 hypothetical protein SAMN05421803_11375 [Nocardiopsis flavescens]